MLDEPTYVVFIDYSTAYPSVHQDKLSSILHKNEIQGHMWHHLRARYHAVSLRVLHPGINEIQTVHILRGLLEGSRLSPTLFGIFVADLVRELSSKFPHVVLNTSYNPPTTQVLPGVTQIWIEALLARRWGDSLPIPVLVI